MATGVFLLAQGTADAVMVGLCNKCHAMHNSQDGTHMTVGTTQAQNYLLRVAGCVACHTGDAGDGAVSAQWSAPIVLHTTDPAYDETGNTGITLAGGNFYWVATSGDAEDNKGHNVVGVASPDATLSEPPGNTVGTNFSGNLIECESCHIGGAHHYNAGSTYSTDTDGWADGSSRGASYRFLSGGGASYIQGGENGDWEFTYASDDHNAYYGDATPATGSSDTFQAHCNLCHGDFHGTYVPATDLGAGSASPWRRHPTDFQLSAATGTEYAAYVTYEVQSPVGTNTTGAGSLSFSAVAAGDDIVVCTSCHRAHGSPYADMLRWSYGLMDAGTGGTDGCFVCHTTK